MDSPVLLKSDKPQKVKYGSETDYTVQITSKDVVIHCKSGSHNHGSSKVKLTDKIDFNWEMKYYQGQLVAVHMNGVLLACAMKSKDGGMVRLLNRLTNKRELIKNLKNDVRDVSFAFLKEEIILGCVDDTANVLIYEIYDRPDSIQYKKLLHVYHPQALTSIHSNFKMVWCPYLPSADDDPDAGYEDAKMFVFLNGSKAEVWDICSILSKCENGIVKPEDNFAEGYVEIDHSMHVVDVSFSSDGTVIATACLDGYVKFYQIYMVDDEKQKLLHQWIPHEGKPLSCLIFIDNILEYRSDSRFWKYAITGANHNSELKLWSCETWACLQTIHFKIDPKSIIPNLFFKICIDHSGQYVVMSDINNKLLYVLQIKRNDDEKVVAVRNISQFLLPAPFLSFHITKAVTSRTPFISFSNEDLFEAEEFDPETEFINSVNIDLCVIQPKKFQECNIVFSPESYLSTSRDNSVESCDDVEKENVPKLNDLQSSVTKLIQQQTGKSQMNLMTPEDFTPGANSRSSSVRNSLEPSQEKLQNNSVENLLEFDRPLKNNYASGGSSPSREVQEILSLNNSTYSNPEYFENLSKLQEPETSSKMYNQKEKIFNETSSKELIWPKIPVVKDNGLIKEETPAVETIREDMYKSNLQTLNFRLTSLETALREQTVLIENLRQEVSSSKMKQSNTDVREDISKELELALSKHQLQMAKFMENLFSMHKVKEREMHDNLMANLTQLINKNVSDKIRAIVGQEMKNVVMPTVMSLKHQLDIQFNQKTNQADIYLKENIAKIVVDKNLTHNIAQSVVSTVTPSLEKCYRDMITNSLIPSCEKVCGNMFQQINETFTKGTKEYTTWVETYVDRQRKTQEKAKDLTNQINSATETFKNVSDQLIKNMTFELQKNASASFKGIQDSMFSNIREIVSEEVRLGFKNQESVIEDSVLNAVRSRSVTPASHMVDSQVKFSRIKQYLATGQMEEALKMALSAENLSYVIYVCEKVDVNNIFGGAGGLPQSCLLSLIQQLSMDLAQNTDVKLSYIHAAILGLDRNDPDTKRFVNKILKDLAVQLTSFINSNPPYKHKSTARILLMAIENVGPNMFNMSI